MTEEDWEEVDRQKVHDYTKTLFDAAFELCTELSTGGKKEYKRLSRIRKLIGKYTKDYHPLIAQEFAEYQGVPFKELYE